MDTINIQFGNWSNILKKKLKKTPLLQKNVDSKYLEKPFSTLVSHMLNPDDGVFLYTQKERKEARKLGKKLQNANQSGQKVIFSAVTNEGNLKPINLEDKLQDHAEDIVLTKEIEDDIGFEELEGINILYGWSKIPKDYMDPGHIFLNIANGFFPGETILDIDLFEFKNIIEYMRHPLAPWVGLEGLRASRRPLWRAMRHSQIDYIPDDIMQLDSDLTAQIQKWNFITANEKVDGIREKYPWDEYFFNVEFSKDDPEIEARYTARDILIKIIELTAQHKPYKGIYFCSGHAPFIKGIYEYDDEHALKALKPFSQGNWTFVDKKFGEDPRKDKHLLDLCKSAGMSARLVRHDLNDGYPTYLGEGCYDITMLFEIKDKMPVEFQHQYAMRALRQKGLIFPSHIDHNEDTFEYGGGLIEKVFLAGFKENNYIRSRFDYITHPNLCRKISSFKNHPK